MSGRYEILNLMRTMANDIVGLEVLVDYAAEAAAELDAAGRPDEADMLRTLARQHQVKSLELQGQLAAARVTYAGEA